MTVLLLLLGLLTGVAAAARSTWSPCGLSMLSSITPFGERSRGHRYGITAGWFVLGATVGGVTLGGAAAALAAVVAAAGLGHHPAAVAGAGAVLAAVAAGVDAGAFGEVLPLLRRQVNDAWLSRYRPWVYGAGFGWQIGVGVATYLMTAGVLVVFALAALSGSPLAAVTVGAGFGLARGLTVFLTSRAPTPARLRELHGFLDAVGPGVRWAVVGVQAGVAAAMAVAAAGVFAPGSGAGLAAGAALVAAGALAGGAVPALPRRPGAAGAPGPGCTVPAAATGPAPAAAVTAGARAVRT